MLVLAIDTSNPTGSVALLRDKAILDEISGRDEVPYSTRLFRDLALLQSRAGFRMDQIDVFAVSSGPGSFTGLRVGLAAVKAWAEVYSRPIAAISSLEAVAAQSRVLEESSSGDYRVISSFLDARRGQVFGSSYRRLPGEPALLEPVTQESVLSPEEFLTMALENSPGARPVLVSATPEALPIGLIERYGLTEPVEPVSAALARVIGRLAFEYAKHGNLVDALQLNANYVRRSDAETAWDSA